MLHLQHVAAFAAYPKEKERDPARDLHGAPHRAKSRLPKEVLAAGGWSRNGDFADRNRFSKCTRKPGTIAVRPAAANLICRFRKAQQRGGLPLIFRVFPRRPIDRYRGYGGLSAPHGISHPAVSTGWRAGL